MDKHIHIGVCKSRDDDRFKKSLTSFTDSLCGYYKHTLQIVENKYLPDAQNEIASSFLDSNSKYLLLLDDDHWGHTREMLDCMLNSNELVTTMRTYSRHYPYVTAAWNWVNENTTIPIERGDGYVKVDLTGFPMTLIRREVFDLLDKPYFRPFENGTRTWHSDVDFFGRLAKRGVKPVVCYQHILNHDIVTPQTVESLRFQKLRENRNNDLIGGT